MKLIGKKVLVKQMRTKDESEGGIALPDSMSAVLPYGFVQGVGPLVEEVDQALLREAVVLFDPLPAVVLGDMKPDHVLIEPEDILAILEEGEY
jgi:co-chaperonin GroES (HSP10)